MSGWHRAAMVACVVPVFLTLLLVGVSAQEIKTCLIVELTTSNVWFAGTDNRVELELELLAPDPDLGMDPDGPGVRHWRYYNLNNKGDDRERGDVDTYYLTENLPKDVCSIKTIRIWKDSDGWFWEGGGWKLAGLRVYYDKIDSEHLLYANTSVNKWLEDDDRRWSPSDFVPMDCPPPLPPVPPPEPPPECYVYETTESSDVPKARPDSDCDGIPDDEDPDPDGMSTDTDGDGIPDARELLIGTDPNNPDTDGDQIPDGYEDKDWDGEVDPGETDAKEKDTDGDGKPDGSEDEDGDGLPDWAELQLGTNPKHPDSDGDGWWDGPTNVRTCLQIEEIRCVNGQEEFWTDDELYLVVDHVRFPRDTEDIDGYWSLDDDDSIDPGTIVARRVRAPNDADTYWCDVSLREDDWYDWTDDTLLTKRVAFGDSGRVVIRHDDPGFFNDVEYEITLVSRSSVFYDPNPTRADSDLDLDGLTDEEERGLSVDSATFGLSDPGIRDIFLEIDWAGNQWKPEWYSISDVASQFYYHGYPLHIDAGELGGGQEILLKESLDSPKGFLPKLYLSSSRGTPSVEQLVGKYLAPSRHGLFRYVVATAIVENRWSLFGLSRMPILDDVGEMVPECCPQRVGMMVIKSDFLDHVSDLESIVLMHELGHSLGLCHRDQDQKPPHPVSPPHCPHNPNDRHGSYCTDCRSCSHYWTSSDSETAMGSGFKVSTGGGIIGATIGFALGGLPGGVTGGVFGATVSSISDALGREVNFSESEWRALELRGIDHW